MYPLDVHPLYLFPLPANALERFKESTEPLRRRSCQESSDEAKGLVQAACCAPEAHRATGEEQPRLLSRKLTELAKPGVAILDMAVIEGGCRCRSNC